MYQRKHQPALWPLAWRLQGHAHFFWRWHVMTTRGSRPHRCTRLYSSCTWLDPPLLLYIIRYTCVFMMLYVWGGHQKCNVPKHISRTKMQHTKPNYEFKIIMCPSTLPIEFKKQAPSHWPQSRLTLQRHGSCMMAHDAVISCRRNLLQKLLAFEFQEASPMQLQFIQ